MEKDLTQEKNLIVAGIFGGLAWLTRSVGIALILGVCSWLLIFTKIKRKKIVSFIFPVVFLKFSWILVINRIFYHQTNLKEISIYQYYLGYGSVFPGWLDSIGIVIVQNIMQLCMALISLFSYLSNFPFKIFRDPIIAILIIPVFPVFFGWAPQI